VSDSVPYMIFLHGLAKQKDRKKQNLVQR